MTTSVENFNAAEFFGSAYQSLVDAGIDQQTNDITRYPLVEVTLPCSDFRWLLTEFYPDTNTGFGLCDLGMGFPELGYVDFEEVFQAVESKREAEAQKSPLYEFMMTEMVDFYPQCRVMNAIEKIDVYATKARFAEEIVMLPEAEPSSELASMTPVMSNPSEISLTDFLHDYHGSLLDSVAEQLPPLFEGNTLNADYDAVLHTLSRQPLGGQREKIHAVLTGLIEQNLEAVILNGEMGTGKTFMSIATAAVYHQHHQKPILVMCPPHLVYKWRREILATIDNAKVTVVNGSDAINKLLKLRDDVIEGETG